MNKIQDNQLVIYQTENGEIKVDVKLHDETAWLSLNQMSQIFERDKSVIAKHLKNIFKEGELASSATVANFATVQNEGERAIKRTIKYYNLDAILSVGYRVNSKRGVEFRKWASKILKDYLVQGYNINHDKVTSKHLAKLKQTIELLSTTLINQNLATDTGKELLRLIKSYTKTWDMLIRYDEDNFNMPVNLQLVSIVLLDYQEAIDSISVLKEELQHEAGNLFGIERGNMLKAILGNIEQTFGGESLYPSVQEKAAHLLYFLIKDHPFSDGNKRIGSLLFLLYLSKAKIGLKNMNETSMTTLALMIAESHPVQKEIIIKLIMNLISD